MKPSTICRRAAKMVFDRHRLESCIVIAMAQGRSYEEHGEGWWRTPLVERYANLFRPRGSDGKTCWLDKLDVDLQHEWRITALCLMAAIAESEE